ncbi:MAG: AmmeMemoRadiSam system protein A [Austwickia sp.]|nr:AmmeMemoRadiSam system protein A [Austwickia sp.]MCO5308622.1 AmmeMemoRadiSam system protein A [Austwickia sp.]
MTVSRTPEATADRGPILLDLAERAIRSGLGLPDLAGGPPCAAPWLDEVGAAFVTLHVAAGGGRPRLRGCIGTIEPYRSLREDVEGNARSASFRDPRFPPLTPAEFPDVAIEVSVLSPREALPYVDRADLVAKLRPFVDGLVLEYGGRRGTYLPQVWDQIPDPADFLASLVMKARLPQGFWSDDIAISRYTVTAYPAPPHPGGAR